MLVQVGFFVVFRQFWSTFKSFWLFSDTFKKRFDLHLKNFKQVLWCFQAVLKLLKLGNCLKTTSWIFKFLKTTFISSSLLFKKMPENIKLEPWNSRLFSQGVLYRSPCVFILLTLKTSRKMPKNSKFSKSTSNSFLLFSGNSKAFFRKFKAVFRLFRRF